ncbi:MAG: TVP38/TMEM64 family protein [Eubacteriales bacterium]
MNKSKRRILILMVFLAISAAGLFIWHGMGYSWSDLWDMVAYSAPLSFLLLAGIYLLKVFVWFIPLNALYIGAGILFPPAEAVILTFLFLFAELSLGYYMGRKLGEDSVRRAMEKYKYSNKLLELTDKNTTMSCFLLRMLPGPPVDITNLFFGSLGIKFVPYVLSSILGLTPGMLPFVFMGKAASDPLSPQFLIPFTIGMAVGILSFALYYFILRRQKRRHGEES